MSSDFLIVAITQPSFFDGEVIKINEILQNHKAHFVHIRKPNASKEEIESLILGIESKFYNRLTLHDHFELLNTYPIGGVHLNSRNPKWDKESQRVSKSLHSIEEIKKTEGLDYFFLSPIFDSISKTDYKAAFQLEQLPSMIKEKNCVALGGVTPDKFTLLKSLNFKGAAMLSYFFPNP